MNKPLVRFLVLFALPLMGCGTHRCPNFQDVSSITISPVSLLEGSRTRPVYYEVFPPATELCSPPFRDAGYFLYRWRIEDTSIAVIDPETWFIVGIRAGTTVLEVSYPDGTVLGRSSVVVVSALDRVPDAS